MTKTIKAVALLLALGPALPVAADPPAEEGQPKAEQLIPLLRFPTAKKGEASSRLENPVLLVFYNDDVDPASVKATLDGRDVSSAFHPAGGSERVRLPLHAGENLLEVEVARKAPTEGPPLSAMESLPQLHTLKIVTEVADSGREFTAKSHVMTLTPEQKRALQRGEAVDLGDGLPPLRIPKQK